MLLLDHKNRVGLLDSGCLEVNQSKSYGFPAKYVLNVCNSVTGRFFSGFEARFSFKVSKARFTSPALYSKMNSDTRKP